MILDKQTIESQTEYFLSEFERLLVCEIESLDKRVQYLVDFVLKNKGKRLRPYWFIVVVILKLSIHLMMQ